MIRESADLGGRLERADVALARSAARGDVRAFERLYREHVHRVHALAWRMAGAELAPDLTQEVFVRAWEKLGTFRGDAAFGTWLHRLAANVILGRRAVLATERSRRVEDEDVLERVPGPPPQTDLGIDFERAISRLPEGARMVFLLYDVEGYRHEEIGELLGITAGTSKAQLHRARMLLRGHLTCPASEVPHA